MPAIATAGARRTVNGAISFAPDARPMLGPLPGLPGYFVACAFLGGIAQAAGVGLAMAEWILEGDTELDLSFIDVARFGDWTSREFARARTCIEGAGAAALLDRVTCNRLPRVGRMVLTLMLSRRCSRPCSRPATAWA